MKNNKHNSHENLPTLIAYTDHNAGWLKTSRKNHGTDYDVYPEYYIIKINNFDDITRDSLDDSGGEPRSQRRVSIPRLG